MEHGSERERDYQPLRRRHRRRRPPCVCVCLSGSGDGGGVGLHWDCSKCLPAGVGRV